MARRGVQSLLLLALLLAGCASPPAEEPPATPHLLALDGRWDFPRERADAVLARAGLPAAAGAAWFGGGILRAEGGPLAVDYAAFEPGALALVAPGLAVPASGEALLDGALAGRHGVAEGDVVELRAWRWPTPLIATSFEMERTRPCDPEAPAKLCFAPSLEPTVTELRLRVDEGAQDLAFLPDMAELGVGNVPAWWNGTFLSPAGRAHAFQAMVDAQGAPSPGEHNGSLEPGTWTIRYHLETLRGGRMPAGLAGIVRLREPGYHWFDDRLQRFEDPAGQARAVLAAAEPVNLTLRVRALADLPPALAGAGLLLSPEDARRVEGAAEGRVGGLVLNLTSAEAARTGIGRERATDLVSIALYARPLAAPPAPPADDRTLLFRAPPDVDPAALPPVEGALAPTRALGLRTAVGAVVSIDGRNLTQEVLFLAHADERPPPWTMPPGARWRTGQEAMENLTRSRTLVLASDDLAPRNVTVGRLVMGDEVAGRVAVIVGVVEGGPRGVLWASVPLAAGAGEPAGALVVLPLAPGADSAAVAARAQAAWAPFGVALEDSRKA